MMGVATLGGIPFRLDPTSVAWEYKVKSTTTKTVGGKVVQIYGVTISNMIVQGTFGSRSQFGFPWQEQQAFLQQAWNWSQSQLQILPTTQGVQSSTGNPTQVPGGNTLTFFYPGFNWNFEVYLMDYSQPGESTSVTHHNSIVAPQWALNLFIVQDNNSGTPGNITTLTNPPAIQAAAIQSYINNLIDGIGWQQSPYNGPLGSLPENGAPPPAAPPPPPPPPAPTNQTGTGTGPGPGEGPGAGTGEPSSGGLPFLGGIGGGGGGSGGATPPNNPENPNAPNFGT